MSPEVVLGGLALVATFLTNQYFQRRVEREKLNEVRREQIAPLMEDLFNFIRRAGKNEARGEDDEVIMGRIQTGLLLWGTRPVIEAWVSWIRLAERGNLTNTEALHAMIDMVHVIREAFGHEDEGMAKRDLMRTYMTNIDEELAPDDVFVKSNRGWRRASPRAET